MRHDCCAAFATIVLTACSAAPVQPQPTPTLVEARVIWDAAAHNAFTDLVSYRGRLLCAFREGSNHHSNDGSIRILASTDGKHWSSVSRLSREGWDLRDPKLSVKPGAGLLLHIGGRKHDELSRLQTFVYESGDGDGWNYLGAPGADGYWLWGASWRDRTALSVGYKVTGKTTTTTRLYRSSNGVDFTTVVPTLSEHPRASETAVVFLADATALALMRCDPAEQPGQLGRAAPPYDRWTFTSIGARIGGQRMLRLADGRIVVATRLYDEPVRTSLAWLDPATSTLTEFLVLPSGGDTSYPGLAMRNGELWVSYYSSHEDETSKIFMARVAL